MTTSDGVLAEIRRGFGELRIVDVGALWTGKPPPYAPLLAEESTRLVGFEPIREECDALEWRFGPHHVFLPYAIGDGGAHTFYRCDHAMTSSLFDPDLAVMDRYHDLSRFCRVEQTVPMQTTRLDDVPEARGADYLKIDIQGGELAAFEGAAKTLESILIVQTEVEFSPIYRHQPLFADVDRALRDRGFMFLNFRDLEGRALRSAPASWASARPSHQTLWADAVYVRDFETWSELALPQLLKFAHLMHHVYQAFDFAAELLARCDARMASDYYGPYCDVAFGGVT